MAATRRKGKKRAAKRRGTRGWGLKALYVASLVALGGLAGVVLGAVTETPRLLIAWLQGPVERVEITPVIVKVDDTTLEEFREMQLARTATPPRTAPAPEKTPPAAPAPVAAEPQRAPEKTAVEAKPVVAPAISKPPRAAGPRRPAFPRSTNTPRPPQVASGPRSTAPPARTPDEIIQQLEKQTRPVPGTMRTSAQQTASSGKPRKVVQIGAHARSAKAEEQVRSLRQKGFDAYVSNTRPKGSKSKYRVRVRPRASETTRELVSKLRARGFQTWTTSE